MKICIPTTDQNGLDSLVSAHFGRARHLAVVDAASQAVEFLPRDLKGCGASQGLREREVDAVLCHGMGQGALANLSAMGIPVYVTGARTLREVLAGVGDLARMDPESACAGHDHAHAEGHGCCGGH